MKHKHLTFTANDRSLNILFFPELRDSKGFTMAAGGKAYFVTISGGKIFNKNKFQFIISANLFISKFKKQFYNLVGFKQTTSTLGVVDNIWSVLPYLPPNYYNNLTTFGVGVKPQLIYGKKRLKFKMSAEINKGFLKIIDQTFRTQFISNSEPEKNAIYFNSVSTKGSNLKFHVGLVYSINKKSNTKLEN
jgi:hypothetical protein